jgi:Ser/Thr protein kinase RdoA (MazF antagonist)
MEEIGALLAHYHIVACRIEVTGQRPGAVPLADVPRILLSDQLDASCPDPEQTAAIRRLAEQLAEDLATSGHPAGPHIVIHGDFTNHNVVASGVPPVPTGVIDYQLAHAEVPLADLGYGLWRSGRPHEDADCLDLARFQQFIRGYAAIGKLSAGDVDALPTFLYGRGLQMIAKRVQAGRADTNMFAQAHWLSANAPAIADAAAAALP